MAKTDITIAGFGEQIVWPAIRAAGKHLEVLTKDTDLRVLGFAPDELSGLAKEIVGLLAGKGWTMEPKELIGLRPDTSITRLIELVARRSRILGGPKTCPLGHGQAYPGQTVCGKDGLPFG